MTDELKFDPDALRNEFADYCTEVEPGIKAKAPRLNQLETLALIGMTVFQAAKELKHEKAASIAALEAANARIAELEAAAKVEPVAEVGPRLYDGLANPIRWTDMEAMNRLPIGTKLYTGPADASVKPCLHVYQARARGVEKTWTDVNHNGFLAALAMRSMEARILYTAPLLPAQSLETLRNVIRCLRETGIYRDEEGESTNALQDLISGYSNDLQPTASLAQPLEAQADARWQPIETAPEGKLLVVCWLDKEDAEHPERHEFDYLEDGVWAKHADDYDHFCCVAPPGSRGPSAGAPYTHWMPLPKLPAALSQKAGEQQ